LIVVHDPYGRPALCDAGTDSATQIYEAAFIELIEGIAVDRKCNGFRCFTDSEGERPVRQSIVTRRLSCAIAGGPLHRGRLTARMRQDNVQRRRGRSLIPFVHGDIFNAQDGFGIVVEDYACPFPADQRSIGGVTQPHVEILVRLIDQVASHLHRNRARYLSRIEREVALGWEVIAACDRRSVHRGEIQRHGFVCRMRQSYCKDRFGRVRVAFVQAPALDDDSRERVII
jgi:hypothetical protein